MEDYVIMNDTIVKVHPYLWDHRYYGAIDNDGRYVFIFSKSSILPMIAYFGYTVNYMKELDIPLNKLYRVYKMSHIFAGKYKITKNDYTKLITYFKIKGILYDRNR